MLHRVGCTGDGKPLPRCPAPAPLQQGSTTIYIPLALSDVFEGTWSQDASGGSPALPALQAPALGPGCMDGSLVWRSGLLPALQAP